MPTTTQDVGVADDGKQDEESWTVHSLSLTQEIAFISVVSACQLFTQSGLGMSIAPLHIIGDDMGIRDEPAYLSWSPAAYSLTVGTFILVAGRIGDLYGHKRAVIWGWIWYGFWSLIGGESHPPASHTSDKHLISPPMHSLFFLFSNLYRLLRLRTPSPGHLFRCHACHAGNRPSLPLTQRRRPTRPSLPTRSSHAPRLLHLWPDRPHRVHRRRPLFLPDRTVRLVALGLLGKLYSVPPFRRVELGVYTGGGRVQPGERNEGELGLARVFDRGDGVGPH
jgi:hypothetical protein